MSAPTRRRTTTKKKKKKKKKKAQKTEAKPDDIGVLETIVNIFLNLALPLRRTVRAQHDQSRKRVGGGGSDVTKRWAARKSGEPSEPPSRRNWKWLC
jgi:hypothetical protein